MKTDTTQSKFDLHLTLDEAILVRDALIEMKQLSFYAPRVQTEVRQAFWDSFPQFASKRRTRKRQNDYPADIRMSFVDYVDSLAREGQISEQLANRVTL